MKKKLIETTFSHGEKIIDFVFSMQIYRWLYIKNASEWHTLEPSAVARVSTVSQYDQEMSFKKRCLALAIW